MVLLEKHLGIKRLTLHNHTSLLVCYDDIREVAQLFPQTLCYLEKLFTPAYLTFTK